MATSISASRVQFLITALAIAFSGATAHAGNVDRSVSKMEKIINSNVPEMYRADLNRALNRIKKDVSAMPDSCKIADDSEGIVCRAISTATLEIKGVGYPEDTQLQAEESARSNCAETARFRSDCELVKFDCEKAKPGTKYICAASSRATLQHRGTGTASAFKILAEQSAMEACRRNARFQSDCEAQNLNFRCDLTR